jgi:hypothetical protein
MLMWVTKKLLAYLSGGICGRGSINRSRPTSGDAHAPSETSPVCLVHLVSFVYLVHLVPLVNFVQPKTRKPDNSFLMLADFFSILLGPDGGLNKLRPSLEIGRAADLVGVIVVSAVDDVEEFW